MHHLSMTWYAADIFASELQNLESRVCILAPHVFLRHLRVCDWYLTFQWADLDFHLRAAPPKEMWCEAALSGAYLNNRIVQSSKGYQVRCYSCRALVWVKARCQQARSLWL